jgi:hypothetical protein
VKSDFQKGWYIAIGVLLMAGQFLLPEFTDFTKTQDAAISTFIQAVQALLTLKAYDQNPRGNGIKPADPPKS